MAVAAPVAVLPARSDTVADTERLPSTSPERFRPVTVHAPPAPTVVVPTTSGVPPLVSLTVTVTVLPASTPALVPLMETLALSLELTKPPEIGSETVRVAVVSSVMTSGVESAPVLFAVSVMVAVRVFAPSAPRPEIGTST